MTLKYFYKPDLLSFFSLSGKDSIDLINRLSTSNINDTDNEITKTIFTNENGRIIDVASIWRINEEKLILICNTENKKSLIEWIDKFTFEEDINLKESDQYQLIHAFNDNKIIQFKNFDLVDNKIKQFNDDFDFFYISKSSFLNQHETIDLIFDKKLSDEVHNTLLSQDFKEINHEEFSSFKIKNVIPFGHNEINLSFNPLELNLIHLVDFEKGCYVGQEVIARLDTYDKVQKKLTMINKVNSGNLINSPGSQITSEDKDNCMIVVRKKFLNN
ncbi:MAG: hypothetical protein VXZ11_00880 [Chloroflexota bacterium]|nr:hypothetical protein [Chloroflexota bacterium]|tara:strand:- start:1609 stop:2427 length:819 start_codon:yes stop_codon:yes gene_type:complete